MRPPAHRGLRLRPGGKSEKASPWSQVTSLLISQSFKRYALHPMPSALCLIIPTSNICHLPSVFCPLIKVASCGKKGRAHRVRHRSMEGAGGSKGLAGINPRRIFQALFESDSLYSTTPPFVSAWVLPPPGLRLDSFLRMHSIKYTQACLSLRSLRQ